MTQQCLFSHDHDRAQLERARAATEKQQQDHARELQDIIHAVDDERRAAQRKFEVAMDVCEQPFKN
jgi:hypothetical protein